MIKAAVIGVGEMGRNHARIYSNIDDVELVAVVDSNEGTGRYIANKYHCSYFSNYIEMLDVKQPDVVNVVVPTNFHFEIATELINRGIPILLEKPVAATLDEGNRICSMVEIKSSKLMVGHIERFNPAIQELKKRIINNELGKLYKIDVQRIGPFPHRIQDVGVTLDIAVHDIDISNFLLNLRPIKIKAVTQQRIHKNNEDSVVAMLKYPNDVLVTLNVNYLSPVKVRRISVFGERGMFEVDYLSQDLFLYENRAWFDTFQQDGRFSGVSEGNVTKIRIAKKEPLLCEIECFINYVHGGISSSPVSAGEGLYAVEVAHKILQSAGDKY